MEMIINDHSTLLVYTVLLRNAHVLHSPDQQAYVFDNVDTQTKADTHAQAHIHCIMCYALLCVTASLGLHVPNWAVCLSFFNIPQIKHKLHFYVFEEAGEGKAGLDQHSSEQ